MSMTDTKEYCEIVIEKLKNGLNNEICRGRYEEALQLMEVTCHLLYEYNQSYKDSEIEEWLSEIAKNISNNRTLKWADDNTILFYDGFGFSTRGLAGIYLKALCKIGKVIYLVDASRKSQVSNLLTIMEKNKGTVMFMDEKEHLSKINFIENIIEQYIPGHVFMYTRPNDVDIPIVLQHYEGMIKRYQVNLTDHAYWLGVNSFDYCIEFRDYGTSISHHYREISKEKLIKLPFYPIIDYEMKFQGYPIDFNENKYRLVFSGGSLQKTLGADNKYYHIIDQLLEKYPDIVFWYAGRGNSTELDKIIKKYPNRIIHTDERDDLYQVLKKCCFYLNTYPIVGGLMFQYAAMAGKVPMTLKYDEISDGFLANQNNLGIEYYSEEELLAEIDKMLSHPDYHKRKEEYLTKSVMTETEFDAQLKNLVHNGKTIYPVTVYSVDTSRFRGEYLKRLSKAKIDMCVVKRGNPIVIKYLSKEYFIGGILKSCREIGFKFPNRL